MNRLSPSKRLALTEQPPSVGLPVGVHVLAAEVVDSLGLTASASLAVTINGAPSTPVLSLSPNPASTLDILTANIDPVTDPKTMP